MITVGSLFAGIGGIELGLERTGHFQTVWQVENYPYATKVLERHWPSVKRWDDVRTWPQDDTEPVDLICGGFPCPPVSVAGRRRGMADERWLWPEFRRIVGVLKPRWVLVENVRGLLSADAGRAFGGILRDLAGLGYDAQWQVLPAAAFGAPYIRERVFIVAYPQRERLEEQSRQPGDDGEERSPLERDGDGRNGWTTLAGFCRMAYGVSEMSHGDMSHEPTHGEEASTAGDFHGWQEVPAVRTGTQADEPPSRRLHKAAQGRDSLPGLPCESGPGCRAAEEETAHPMQGMRHDVHAESQQKPQDMLGEVLECIGKSERREAMEGVFSDEELRNVRKAVYAAKSQGEDVLSFLWREAGMGSPWACGEWPGQPRVETGVAHRVDRLRCLGNAVVPQVAEWIGHRIWNLHTQADW